MRERPIEGTIQVKFGRRHLGIECTLAEWSADGMTWDNDLVSKGEEIGKSIVASKAFYALPITGVDQVLYV